MDKSLTKIDGTMPVACDKSQPTKSSLIVCFTSSLSPLPAQTHGLVNLSLRLALKRFDEQHRLSCDVRLIKSLRLGFFREKDSHQLGFLMIINASL